MKNVWVRECWGFYRGNVWKENFGWVSRMSGLENVGVFIWEKFWIENSGWVCRISGLENFGVFIGEKIRKENGGWV